MSMMQRKFYLPDDMYMRLQLFAKMTGQNITQALREVVAEGLQQKQARLEPQGTKGLLELVQAASAAGWEHAPADLADNHDTYFAEALEEELQHTYAHHH